MIVNQPIKNSGLSSPAHILPECNHLGNFCRGPYDKQLCQIMILSSGGCFYFLIWQSFIPMELNHLGNFGGGS